MAADDPRIGTEFAGYRIERVLGRGGMGVVYCAEQISLGRRVGLKLIAPELAQDHSLRARFEGEARIAASIDHPNIVPIYEAGELDGTLFLAMRLVDGTDLGIVLEQRGRLSPSEAARVVDQVASALDAAHAHGLVHRDVKPQNILLSGRPGHEHVYLTDFGLTKRVGSEGLTKTGQWVGTLHYVAPEQITGGPVDARADVFALGCVTYQMLTGDVPYRRPSEVAMMFAHVNDPPPRPTASAPELQPQFDTVVDRAMAKDPGERYPSAGDLGRAAVAAAALSTPRAPERTVAIGEAAPQAEPVSAPAWQPPAPPPQPAQYSQPQPQYSQPQPQYSQPQPQYSQPWQSQPQYSQPSYSAAPTGGGSSRRAIAIAVAAVALALMAGILVIVLAGGGDDDGGGPPTTDNAGVTSPDASAPADGGGEGEPRFPYPESSKKAFLDACTNSAGGGDDAKKRCGCVLDELQDKLPFDDFAEADAALRKNEAVKPETQRIITAATTECASG